MPARKKPSKPAESKSDAGTSVALATRDAKIKDVLNTVNSLMGDGTLRRGGDDFKVEYLPTGVLPIDVLLQGGLPRGRFTEIFGDYSTLKSYVALCAAAETQRAGGIVALIDTEHAYDPDWAAALGVDPDRLIVQHPPTGEAAVDATEVLIRSGLDLVIWDSIAATLPKTEQEKSSQDPIQPARLAALMSAAMRKLTAANSKTAILCINQTRINVGQMFGSPESVPGGKSLPFYASYRLALRKAGKVTEDIKVYDGDKYVNTKSQVGQKIKMTVEKSKLNAPHREMWFTFDLKAGRVDDVGFLINYGLEHGLVVQEGQSWHIKGSTTKTRGRAAFRGYLEGQPTQLEKLRQGVLAGSGALVSRTGG